MCRGHYIVPASTCSCASGCQYPNFDCSVILDPLCNYTPFKPHCVVFCAKLTSIHNSDHSSVILLRRFACARSPGTTKNLWSYWFLCKLRQLARSENKARILYTLALFWSALLKNLPLCYAQWNHQLKNLGNASHDTTWSLHSQFASYTYVYQAGECPLQTINPVKI